MNVIEEKDIENKKYENIEKAFTFGVRLHKGQPNSYELYDQMKRIVNSRE